MPLRVGVLDDRDDEPVRRVGGEADVVVALEHQIVAVQRRIHDRVRLQRRDDRLRQQRHHRHLGLGLLGVGALAERLQLRDVRLVVVGDVRDHHPVAGQVRTADLLDPGQRLTLDLTELLEVGLRPRRELEAGRERPPEPPRHGAAAGASLAFCTSSLVIRPLRPDPLHRVESSIAELARQPADARRRVRRAPRSAAPAGTRAAGVSCERRRLGLRRGLDVLRLRRGHGLRDRRRRRRLGAVPAAHLERQDRRALLDLVADGDLDLRRPCRPPATGPPSSPCRTPARPAGPRRRPRRRPRPAPR